MIRAFVLSVVALVLVQPAVAQSPSRAKLDAMIAAHAQANNVPVALVHRVVRRESGYRPHLIGKGGAMGLMQIKVATARGLGYHGTARGLLDPETNLTYAVRYLAGAYLVAGGNHDRAVMHYARGYYYAAKHKGLLDAVAERTNAAAPKTPTVVSAAEVRSVTPAAKRPPLRDPFVQADASAW